MARSKLFSPDERAVGVLLWMTRDAHPSVRKGGCYGLAGLVSFPEVLAALKRIETTDPDNEVRLAASLVLNGFGT